MKITGIIAALVLALGGVLVSTGCGRKCVDGEACVCSNANCDLDCESDSGGNCAFECTDGATCTFDCPGGHCSMNCVTATSCELHCAGGGCSQTCSAQTLICITGECKTGCSQVCGGAPSCDSSCDAADGCTNTP